MLAVCTATWKARALNHVKYLLRNPITIWLRWLIVKTFVEWKYSALDLRVGYLCEFANCNFGKSNTIAAGSVLSNVTLGDFSYVAENSSVTNANIGKFCSIGFHVIVGPGKHPSSVFVSTHPVFYSVCGQTQSTFAKKSYFEEHADVSIGNDVWVGTRAVILDGVSIGDGAIIAAGAVVTKDVPPYAIVGGVPAKIIRYRFSFEEIAFLQRFQWWNRDVEWLKDNLELMHNIESLVEAYKSRPDNWMSK